MLVSKSEPLPEGTVIMADDQFAGRGQQESAWHAEAGLNLTFSILLKPSFLPVQKQFMLNIAVSIGINKALTAFVNENVKVKWPNDIYFEGKKVGGILIENNIAGTRYKSAVVGIGINVNQRYFDIEKVKPATSIAEILNQEVDLIKLLAVLCSHIESEYLKLRTANYIRMTEDYVNGLYKFNQLAWYKHKDYIFEGRIRGITETGQLIIRAGNAETNYNFKEVEFLDLNG